MPELPVVTPAGGGREVWAYASIIEQSTIDQALAMARHPLVKEPVRLMADCHAGVGGAGTVGSVIVMEGGLIPAAIGPDIGCGMHAVRFDAQASALNKTARQDIFRSIMADIPMGTGRNHGRPSESAKSDLDGLTAEFGPVDRLVGGQALAQLGTLGSGNHFIEVSEDEDGCLWAVVHSGSRGIGFKLADRAMKAAKVHCEDAQIELEHRDLSYLPQGTDGYHSYVHDMLWAQRWAKLNRMRMMTAVEGAIHRHITPSRVVDFDCHHNYAEALEPAESTPESGTDSDAPERWLIRKGAIAAYEGMLGVVPGSMGTDSYIVRGLGNEDALNTAPHGAGRMLGRGEARRTLSVDEFKSEMEAAGRVWDMHRADRLLDEAPSAYKPIEQVIADSDQLIEVEHQLSAIINCKG
ncbi:MAG: RtcB family protein [Chloroflexi bacterium]|nr:RtcB family protein [Chloroflexota bacterium]